GGGGGGGLMEGQELLSRDGGEPIGDQSQRDVNRATGGRIRDDLYRPRRILLGVRRCRKMGRERQQRERQREPEHFLFSDCFKSARLSPDTITRSTVRHEARGHRPPAADNGEMSMIAFTQRSSYRGGLRE